MSDTLLIVMADRAPVSPSPSDNTVFHENLLNRLNAEALDRSWCGSAIAVYVRMRVEDVPYISMSIAPADHFASLDDLRAFRERERAQTADLFSN